MKTLFNTSLLIVLLSMISCKESSKVDTQFSQVSQEAPFVWEGANMYFLLTDRFNNGDTTNDINFDRTEETGKLRGFEGGDIKGIIQKINEGYFTELGINAIWFTPIVEQTHGDVDEGTGVSYGYHGYWAKDWTALDPNFGTTEDLHELVKSAHEKGIRVLLDGVINHTSPITDKDPVWPSDWVRTEPACIYKSYKTTVSCVLVDGLPDIKTESNENVELPAYLVEKWKSEGRYEQEISELDAFFERTKYPRAPKYYIIKWLTDYITEFGIDGYRVDTVKHVEEDVWEDFKTECDYVFAKWKKSNPTKVLDSNEFYLVGEAYNYVISRGQLFDYDGGVEKVNFFKNGFNSLINFEFKYDATKNYEHIFSKYSKILNKDLKGYGVLNYISSHDDSGPFDKERTKAFESATKLLLTPGASQVYYGDESARSLIIDGTIGDATLRSNMNWNAIENDAKTNEILTHWQKLGQFRAKHPAVGAGVHQMISESPYVFKRTYSNKDYTDVVVVGLDLPKGNNEFNVSSIFKEGTILVDAYSKKEVEVKGGKVNLKTPFKIVLLELK